jgi:hypothetical protein
LLDLPHSGKGDVGAGGRGVPLIPQLGKGVKDLGKHFDADEPGAARPPREDQRAEDGVRIGLLGHPLPL